MLDTQNITPAANEKEKPIIVFSYFLGIKIKRKPNIVEALAKKDNTKG